MKKMVLLVVLLFVLAVPAFAMHMYLGALGGADLNFYLPYDPNSWFNGFYAHARFPIGGTLLFEFDPLPFGLGINGGYFFETPINLDERRDNDLPYYVEILGYILDVEKENMKNFIGFGIGAWLNQVMPIFNVLIEYRFMWMPVRYFYLSASIRGDFTFDLDASGDGKALAFLQLGLGTQVGLGVYL